MDLCRLAGLAPVAAIGELVRDDGAMMRLPDVLRLGKPTPALGLTIEQLIAWRQRPRPRSADRAETLPTADGVFALSATATCSAATSMSPWSARSA